MQNSLADYYRCHDRYGRFTVAEPLSNQSGYFRFRDSTVYGRCCGFQPAGLAAGPLWDAAGCVRSENGVTRLPFDLTEVVDSLRGELYLGERKNGIPDSVLTNLYYLVRPLMPVALRKHLQRLRVRGWQKLAFPNWPVDTTVDNLMEQMLLLSLQAQGLERTPFIWFWPKGASSCIAVTHDVETKSGVRLCNMLMDIDESFDMPSSFQLVPEQRYDVNSTLIASIRDRGFEIVVHDLNHDGHLFRNYKEFKERAVKINAHGRRFQSTGFRSGVLYRNQEWFDALDFEYDMSVPNVSHLDRQRGGCCTVMPYFIGKLVELPVTMTQDYTLFNILGDYSTTLWQRQMNMINERHGLINVIVHPDYLTGTREIDAYKSLLTMLVDLRERHNAWAATPHEVNTWWRQRSQMRICEDGNNIRIEGVGSERARVAYARIQDGGLVLTVEPASATVVSD
jgi:hypothetical protein